ncbi:MAG: hypothetical protein H6Q31_782 [Bacteroidetes bacterium]|nr:hypothetical protein [Bacteroidota bacterium]
MLRPDEPEGPHHPRTVHSQNQYDGIQKDELHVHGGKPGKRARRQTRFLRTRFERRICEGLTAMGVDGRKQGISPAGLTGIVCCEGLFQNRTIERGAVIQNVEVEIGGDLRFARLPCGVRRGCDDLQDDEEYCKNHHNTIDVIKELPGHGWISIRPGWWRTLYPVPSSRPSIRFASWAELSAYVAAGSSERSRQKSDLPSGSTDH